MALWPSGLGNYFVRNGFAVQTILWTLEFVIQINLEDGTIEVSNLAWSWSISTFINFKRYFRIKVKSLITAFPLYFLTSWFLYFLLGGPKVSLLILVCKQLNFLSKKLNSRLRTSASLMSSFYLFVLRFLPHLRICFELELMGCSSSVDSFLCRFILTI